MTTLNRIGIALALGLGLFVAAPGRAMAQDDPATQIIPSLEFQQADVRDALRALFRNVNVNYSIAPEVQGFVTVSLRNVLFDTALQNILKQVNATYRINSGVYEIVKKEQPVIIKENTDIDVPISTPVVQRRIYIRSADPEFIFMMIRGSMNSLLTPEMSSLKRPSKATGNVSAGAGFSPGFGGGGGFGSGLGGGSGANSGGASASSAGGGRGTGGSGGIGVD